MNILFVFSIPRISERLFPLIPKLNELGYNLDLMSINQFSEAVGWYGDNDPRERFYNNYDRYFSKKYDSYHPCKIDYSKYDLIILDDCRLRNGLDFIYKSKRKTSIVIGQTHGNSDKMYISDNHKKVFDYCFVFGESEIEMNSKVDRKYLLDIGIPSNDILKEYKEKYTVPKHILVIVNFLGNRECPYKEKFDKEFLKKTNYKKLGDMLNLPFIIKLKSRFDESGYKHNLEYLKEIIKDDFKYQVVVDSEDDNKLITESACVFSPPSTLALKPIQIGIPTFIQLKSGAVGLFKKWPFISNTPHRSILIDSNTKKFDRYVIESFVKQTLTGGIEFNSTEIAINKIKELCPIY